MIVISCHSIIGITPSKVTFRTIASLFLKKLQIISNCLFLSITLKLFSASSPLKHYKLLFLLNFF